MKESHAPNAYEAVERLHPMWLRRRGTASTDPANGPDVAVIYNDREVGGPSELRGIRAETILSIQYFDSVMARARWGDGHEFGAIVVTGL